ncbi:MAG TPA: hypothetical protein VEF76_04965 [Patescibacteria group bacterium]|nr:hypothetical protein [Patescibacteria group bacterium]
METTKEKWLAAMSLMTSASTLVCCALPALFVTLGAGAALAGLVSAAPGLVWFTEQKIWVFVAAAVFLAAGGWMQWQARHAPCPVDPAAARSCMRLRRAGRMIYAASLLLYLTGALFAFVLPRLLA